MNSGEITKDYLEKKGYSIGRNGCYVKGQIYLQHNITDSVIIYHYNKYVGAAKTIESFEAIVAPKPKKVCRKSVFARAWQMFKNGRFMSFIESLKASWSIFKYNPHAV